MIQFSQVRCFVAVAQELHFGRAAKRLHMTQPPLSRQIQQLEHALGVVLLERDRRQVRLTAAGRAFLPEADHLMRVAEAASLTAQRATSGTVGSVRLGYVPGISCTLLPPLVAALSRDFPDVDTDLRELSTHEQVDALRSDRLDLGLVRMPWARGEFDTCCLVREAFIAAVPAGHLLASRERLSIGDLHRQPMLMFHPAQGGYFYELLVRLFESEGVSPRYLQYARQAYSMIGLVSAGMGVALMPTSNAMLGLPGVVFLPIDLPTAPVAELHLIWRKIDPVDAPAVEAIRTRILGHAF
ncbi:Hca operon transcriptional activator [Variovorax sp. PBS-H4]|uniref:LysR family transcriptional regulator n=1 Tax=Variovorax sp. PBS-H4 TaxID=434008 RepID=UPI001319625A|nr:LysR family transcriptional regulator [Variovorax sp. PBS-H4]VTU33143.1 Hca operon transcriptional activator [Variovorax sp. PBS-H4]